MAIRNVFHYLLYKWEAMIGGIGIPMNFKAVEWFAPGFGKVKSETYSKNGKLMGSTLLTAYKK